MTDKPQKPSVANAQETSQVLKHAAFKKALAARLNAYAPYSRCKVGAAIITNSGQIYVGCNVENASYGATICAERNAVGAAVAAGETGITDVVVVTDNDPPWPPCGICRQFLMEFNPKTRVLLGNPAGITQSFTLDELLPAAFSAKDLHKP